jgi:sulfide dehydrogenase cytochrome subunit
MKTIIFSVFLMCSAEASVNSCLNCHGNGDVPQINGMSVKYLNAELLKYKNKERICIEVIGKDGIKSDMCKTTATDTEIAEISKTKFVPAKQAFDAALAEKGKAIHKSNCEKCHSENGTLASDDAGILAGQSAGYLRATLKEFSEGKRPIDKKMKAKLEELDNESIEALINFYTSFGSK